MENDHKTLTDSEILRSLQVLKHAPLRKRLNVVNGRAKFLREAKNMLTMDPQPVSKGYFPSLMGWLQNLIPTVNVGKETTMWKKFAVVVVIIAMILGGTFTSAYAAQDSLPGEAIYPVKLVVEDVQEMFTSSAGRVQFSIQRVENRIQEILLLQERGETTTDSTISELRNQLEQLLQYMLQMNDSDFEPELVKVRNRLMVQERLVQDFQNQGNGNDDALLQRVRLMIQNRLELLNEGLKDHEKFKVHVRDQDRISWDDEVTPPTNDQGLGPYGPGYGQNDTTPTAGAYGPGPGPLGSSPTAGAYGPGPGPVEGTPTPGPYGSQYGPLDLTPTPGAYGPGPGPIVSSPTPGAYGPGPGRTP